MDKNIYRTGALVFAAFMFFGLLVSFTAGIGLFKPDNYSYKVELVFENGDKEVKQYVLPKGKILNRKGCLILHGMQNTEMNTCYVRSFRVLSTEKVHE